MKKTYHIVGKQGKYSEKELRKQLCRNGQFLLPMVSLIAPANGAFLPASAGLTLRAQAGDGDVRARRDAVEVGLPLAAGAHGGQPQLFVRPIDARPTAGGEHGRGPDRPGLQESPPRMESGWHGSRPCGKEVGRRKAAEVILSDDRGGVATVAR